jgi:hypothetical protein
VVAIRLNKGTDLVQGVIDACKKHGIRSGWISSMIGSLEAGAKYVAVGLDPKAKTGVGFTGFKTIDGPVEILSGQGMIADNGDDLYVHLHAVFVGLDGKVIGGHVERGYGKALNTLEVVVVETEHIVIGRELDEETGYTVCMPRQA